MGARLATTCVLRRPHTALGFSPSSSAPVRRLGRPSQASSPTAAARSIPATFWRQSLPSLACSSHSRCAPRAAVRVGSDDEADARSCYWGKLASQRPSYPRRSFPAPATPRPVLALAVATRGIVTSAEADIHGLASVFATTRPRSPTPHCRRGERRQCCWSLSTHQFRHTDSVVRPRLGREVDQARNDLPLAVVAKVRMALPP
jgi:hypothetical protein